MKKNNSFWKKLVCLFQKMKRVLPDWKIKHIQLNARNIQCIKAEKLPKAYAKT